MILSFSFPEWLPLDKWVPQVFVASGDCAERQWDFLGLEMPQWLLGIFIAYSDCRSAGGDFPAV